MGLKRRTFLQKAGLALFALGVSETALSLVGDTSFAGPLLERYYQALAKPSARKLALLVGINQYPQKPTLSGCVTDVEMQRELLIHRFGFNPSDVLMLTDQQATRQNIETAFLEHLSKQATAEDVVVFHFSGYGSRVNEGTSAEDGQNSLVPVDSLLLTKENLAVNNLLEETLLLLLRSLPTEQVTTVLDTSYADLVMPLQGNLRVRSCPGLLGGQPSAEELAFQEQLLQRLATSREQLTRQRLSGQIPGVVLAAAGPSQFATEAPWNGFTAGLFTYALTQHLWQATPPMTVQVSLSRAAGVVEQLVGKDQQPQLKGQKSKQESLLPYNLTPESSIGADGVVIGVEENGKSVQLWLAGLPASVLEYYGVNSLLTLNKPLYSDPAESVSDSKDSDSEMVIPHVSAEPVQLQVRSREGLVAKARIISPPSSSENTTTTPNLGSALQVGQLVQEQVRVLPRNIGLTIAIDTRLERIERVDATSAFASVPYVSSVVTAGEQPADYLFGKVHTPESGKDTMGSYGLFSLGLDPIPNTAGPTGEAVKVAINRLVPHFKTLLAAKLWRLTVNEGSSRLGVVATLEVVSPTEQVLMQRETLRSQQERLASLTKRQEGAGVNHGLIQELGTRNAHRMNLASGSSEGGIPTIPVGSRIQYRVQNYSDDPIYFMLLGLDSAGRTIALYPKQFPTLDVPDGKSTLQNAQIPAGAVLTVPNPSASLEWVIQGRTGIAETQLICSRTPLTQTLAMMATARGALGEREQVNELPNPLTVVRALLQDLHQASITSAEASSSFSDSYVLAVNAWATLSFVYMVA